MIERVDTEAVILKIVEEYDADVFFYSAEIDDGGYGKLVASVTASKQKKNVLLILVTNGGSANAGYQIARFLQKTYADGQFILFEPSYCKSAGTLVALGANKLLIDTFSELGPLDVQLLKQDEIGTRKSGLLSRSSFEALQEASFNLFEHLMLEIKRRSYDQISFKLAAEVSSKMTGELMSGVFGQISPDIVGSDYRDLQVALHYGIRLAGYSQNASPSSVRRLVEYYPSHDFVIDDEEASTLFYDTELPSENLYSLIPLLGDAAYNEHPAGLVFALSGPNGIIQEGSDADDDDATGKASSKGRDPEPTELDEGGEEDRAGYTEAPGASEPRGKSRPSRKAKPSSDSGPSERP